MDIYDGPWTETPYRIEYEHGVPFLRFGENFEGKWLFLYSQYFAFACKSEDEQYFAATSIGPKRFHYIFPMQPSVTSFLTEGETKYDAGNLATFAPSRPWVEGVKGPGIGEKIIDKHPPTLEDPYRTRALIFSNGYVSYDKPYLYEKNARVKKLRVYNSRNEFDFEVELEDTPNPQLIVLPVETTEVVLEIREVYPGTQWEDTCVNFIWRIMQAVSPVFMTK